MTTNWRDNLTDLPDDVNKADVLFAWTVEESVRANRMDDVAEAYVVESNPMASCGIIVWAKYHGKWEANPFSTRAIVRKLIDLITPPAEPVPQDQPDLADLRRDAERWRKLVVKLSADELMAMPIESLTAAVDALPDPAE